MTLDHPITTSAVYLLNSSTNNPHHPPPSPPSPATPCERSLSPPIDELSSIEQLDLADAGPVFESRLSNAVHVLGTEATALSHLTRLYDTDPVARAGFNAAIDAITRFDCKKGKLIVSGIGKSGFICQKLVATLKSLKIPAAYLHPTDALHGDLGGINEEFDTILLITFSGSTPELLALLPHLPPLPLLVMTRHTNSSTCEIVKRRPDAILLPAPIHISETDSHGVNAPTTSTTICLALCDALAIVLANHLHKDVGAVFRQFHPGGAIGSATRSSKQLSDLAVPFSEICEVDHNSASGAHILVAAYRSKSRWVRQGDLLMSPKRIEQIQTDYLDEPAACIQGLMVSRKCWVELPDTMDIPQAKEWISSKQHTGKRRYGDDGIIAIMDDDEVMGVLQIGDLMNA